MNGTTVVTVDVLAQLMAELNNDPMQMMTMNSAAAAASSSSLVGATSMTSLLLNSTTATAASSLNSTTAATTVASTASLLIPQPMCPNLDPFARSSVCVIGTESFLLMHPPLWVLLSHSAQGVLALFSLKHVALSVLPLFNAWLAKLLTLRTGGRMAAAHSSTSRPREDGLAAAFIQEEEDEARGTALPALLETHRIDAPIAALSSSISAATIEEIKEDELQEEKSEPKVNDSKDLDAIPSLSAFEMMTAASSSSSSSIASPSSSSAALVSASSSSSSSSSSSFLSSRSLRPSPLPSPSFTSTSISSSQHALLHSLYLSSSSDLISSRLGRNILESVMSFFSARQLVDQMRVSKTWYRSANADHLWIELNRRTLVPEFLKPDNSLSEMIEGMRIQDEHDQQHDTVPAPFDHSHSSPPPPLTKSKSSRRRDFDATLRQHQLKLRHALSMIAETWHAALIDASQFGVAQAATQASLGISSTMRSRHEIEQDYLDATHKLTDAIAKINQQIAYIKKAQHHARQALEIVGTSSSSRVASSSSSSSSAASNRGENDPTSALLLTSCALVQAVHRYCSGTSNPKLRQRRSSHASSSFPAAHASSSSPLPSSMEETKEDDESHSDLSSMHESMANDANVLNQVLQEQEGIRRRHRSNDDEKEDEMPPSRPVLQSSASHVAPHSTSSSSAPALQRSLSLPTSNPHHPAPPSLPSLLPPRRWHSISDVLLLMETSGLVTFQFSIEEAINLHAPKKEKEKEKRKEKGRKQGKSATKANTSSTSSAAVPSDASSSSTLDLPSDSTFTTASMSPDEPDDDNNDESDSEDDDGSSSSSDFDPAEMDDWSDDDEDGDDDDDDVAAAEALLPQLNTMAGQHAPALSDGSAASSSSSQFTKRLIFVAAIDEVGNLFITAQDLPPTPQVTSNISTILPSTSPLLLASASSTSSITAAPSMLSLPAPHDSALSPALSPSLPPSSPTLVASTSSSSSSQAMTLAQVLDAELNAAKAASAKVKRKPASAKLAFKSALEFLKLQNSIDQTRRDETALARSRRQTMRLHELFRQCFKGLILASMLYSFKDQGVIHLLMRYGAFIALVITILQLCGVEFEIDLNLEHAHAHAHAHGGVGPHDHGHAHGGGGGPHDGDDADENENNNDHNNPAPGQPSFLNFNAIGQYFGLSDPTPPAAPGPDGDALNLGPNNNVPQVEEDPEHTRRVQWRRFFAALSIVGIIELSFFFFGYANPPWFTNAFFSCLRFLPLSMLLLQALLLFSSDLTWRSRELQVWFAVTLLMEAAFWYLGFHSEMMESFLLFSYTILLPRIAKFLILLARIAPVTSVFISIIYMLVTIFNSLFPMPVNVQLHQIWHILRHDHGIRRTYAVFFTSIMIAFIGETLCTYFGFTFPLLPTDVFFSRMRTITPLLSSLAYDCLVFESRGVLLGLALMRFVWVVEASLPIHCLTILKQVDTPNSQTGVAKKKKKGEQKLIDANKEKKTTESNELIDETIESSSTSSSPSHFVSSPRIVCLSCIRHSQPFRAVRYLTDLIFETHLLVSQPFSGVQSVQIQRKEQELQLVDFKPVKKTMKKAGITEEVEEQAEEESSVQIQTCVSCTLHSVHMQLFLPFFYFLLIWFLFTRIFPMPSHSTYRDIIFSTLHYIFDRVPMLVVIDLIMGWYNKRVLKYRKAYYIVSGLVLTYASYVACFSWWNSITHSFFYHLCFNAPSLLPLDFAWVILWIIDG